MRKFVRQSSDNDRGDDDRGDNDWVLHTLSACTCNTAPPSSALFKFLNFCLEPGVSAYHCACTSTFSEANAGPQPGSDRKKYCTKYCEEGRQILILFGTEYGFSEELAKKLFDRIVETHSDVPLQPRILNAKYFEKVELDKEQLLLCAFSTCGDGERNMP